MRRLLLALTLATALCAVWSGWSWYAAAHDDEADFSRLREHVLREGTQAVQNLNTLDHRDLKRGLDLWEGATTGELHRQITRMRLIAELTRTSGGWKVAALSQAPGGAA